MPDRVLPFSWKRLRKEYCSEEECLLAIRGQQLPRGLGFTTTRLCVVRGIRYHPGFATELHGTLPLFTRALNARRIMSNDIPDMENPEDFPYCIWYPEQATEDTYRRLASRYPGMKYQVGRACAVAGYYNLFKDLGLLPESHIAEEARDNQQWPIYEDIMRASIRYNAMDDYSRTVYSQPIVGHLNGDTAVRSYLDIKTKFRKPESKGSYGPFRRTSYFDIAEDDRVDELSTKPPRVTEDVTPLLYTPLPVDLPTMNKDLLILMAAYYGDIDRYSRLRRPASVYSEQECIVRGIYHNTLFAKWWSTQPDSSYNVSMAINARYIMNNDLSRITPDTVSLPYVIWYPSMPRRATCRELARRAPSMKPAIAMACILTDYEDVWDLLDVDPDSNLMCAARESHNPKYLNDLESKIAERGCRDLSRSQHHALLPRRHMFEPSVSIVPPNVTKCKADLDGVPYNGYGTSMAYVELFVTAPDTFKEGDGTDLDEYYDSLGQGLS
ncbi:uncharacterized protein LDX57_007168 [Aspergillus melleus]|uniref:uncharacterized protein n=1 Tax=Aspergillus melleus TaxID=138277 RepID=UPI001E8D8553|nr:uncharacterized protein LDX57_007168 [Aspergillus melleus]KAH8429506.1 hypothetical protein LDX57_007168 [Aspergillus melleus]